MAVLFAGHERVLFRSPHVSRTGAESIVDRFNYSWLKDKDCGSVNVVVVVVVVKVLTGGRRTGATTEATVRPGSERAWIVLISDCVNEHGSRRQQNAETPAWLAAEGISVRPVCALLITPFISSH